MDGFWGVPTSTVDWCEANYQITPWIAEFWNTVSSLAMVLAGVLGFFVLGPVYKERRFRLAYLLLAVVGFGSIAFHGTLLFELQMFDELPMIWLALVVVYILVENRDKTRFGRWFPLSLFAYAVFLTAFVLRSRGTFEFYLFHLSFGSLEFLNIYWIYRIYKNGDPKIRALFVRGASCYSFALVAWFTDLKGCAWLVPNPQLHAWWHVFVSFGMYYFLRILGENRLPRFARVSVLPP